VNTKNKYRLSTAAPFILVLLFFSFPISFAQSDTTKRPLVGEHTFTPVTYSNLPFTNTYFYTLTGFGQTTDLVHQLGSIGNYKLQGLEGEVAFIDMGISYQQRVRDWLAGYINLHLSARVGTELQSILSQGINTVNSFEIGWHFKLIDGNKHALSSILELQNHRGSVISVLGYLQDIIEDHPNPSLNQNIPVLAFATGICYAYGLNDLVGLKASLDLAYGETYTRGLNGFSFEAGTGIDFDFYPRYKVPVGLVLQYAITSMPEFVYVEGEHAQVFRSKIAYTKADDFSLGIEYSYMKVPLINQEKPPSVMTFALVARYYF